MTSSVSHELSPELQAQHLGEKGFSLHKQGKFDDALVLFNQAIALCPQEATAYFYRGIAHHERGQPDLAMKDFNTVMELAPRNQHMLKTMGEILLTHDYSLGALNSYRMAVENMPDDAQAWLGMANAHMRLGNSATLEKLYAHLVQKFPNDIAARLSDALFVPPIPESQEAILHSRERVLQKMQRMLDEKFKSNDPFKDMRGSLVYLSYHNLNYRPIAEKLAQFLGQVFPGLHYTAPHGNRPRKARGEKLKLGFVSPSMHLPVLNQFFLGVADTLSEHPQFDVYLFSNAPASSPVVKDIMARHKHYIALPADLEKARDLIAAQEMDILVYLEIGISKLMYQLAYARLAPVQCVWGGVPVTTGIPNMDYYLTCEGAEPEDYRDHYTEEPVKTSRTVCMIERPKIVPPIKTREQLGFPKGENLKLYACPAMLYKLHPDMDTIFAAILARDPHAVILLFDTKLTFAQNHLKGRFAKAIPEEHMPRIFFKPFLSQENFLSMLKAVDCVLDPFHYSFGSTAYMAFAANAPFVTFKGAFMRGLAGHRMYNLIGVPELIAHTPEEYVELAIKLANDKHFYNSVTEKITAKSDVFFNDHAVVDEFAELLATLYFDRSQ